MNDNVPKAVASNDLLGPVVEFSQKWGMAIEHGTYPAWERDMRSALDAAVAAERERCKARAVQIVEWHRNDYNRQQIDPIVAELRNGL
jgi:hypothetical protein